MAVISMKTLFEAGVHFGHKTQKWHPKMKEYIYGSKAGIYIIDIRQTMEKLKAAYELLIMSLQMVAVFCLWELSSPHKRLWLMLQRIVTIILSTYVG